MEKAESLSFPMVIGSGGRGQSLHGEILLGTKGLRSWFRRKLVSPIKRYIIPYLFTPSLFSVGVLRTDRPTDKILHPVFLKFFFSHWAFGAPPAGATLLGWPNCGVDGRLNEECPSKVPHISKAISGNPGGNSWGIPGECTTFLAPRQISFFLSGNQPKNQNSKVHR